MFFDLITAIPFPTWIDDEAFPIGPLSIKWYGLGYIVGVLLAFLYAKRTAANKEYWIPKGMTRGADTIPNKEMLEDFAFYCLVGIIVGGRLGSILLYDISKYIDNPLAVFKIWEGGMAFHGGFLGVCAAAWFITRKYKASLWRWADMAAIGAPLGLFLVRLANFANQELWGRPTDVPWAIVFRIDKDAHPRHPSQLYEAFLEGIVIFLVLYVLTRKTKILTKPGLSAGVFIFLYGVFRTFVEFFREPDNIPQIHEYFTRGMLYSVPMIIIGLMIILWAGKRQPVAPRRMSDESA